MQRVEIFRFDAKQDGLAYFKPNFLDKVTTGLEAMRPFFDFMTEALTTNLNGESTI